MSTAKALTALALSHGWHVSASLSDVAIVMHREDDPTAEVVLPARGDLIDYAAAIERALCELVASVPIEKLTPVIIEHCGWANPALHRRLLLHLATGGGGEARELLRNLLVAGMRL